MEEQEAESCIATIHSELSLTHTIDSTDKPLNCFQNQLVFEEARSPSKRSFILFGNKRRHLVSFSCKESLIIEHNRAHRSAQENVKQVLSEYYFPKMAKLASEIVSNCKTCARAKYERHPKKQELGETSVPSQVGEMLHIDIFSTDRKYFLTCIDKFSKFATVQPILSRTIEDLKPALLQLLNVFPKAKVIYCDNEPSLNSHTILTMLESHFGVSVSNALPLHSVSNGKVKRFHSTLVELARCLKIDKGISDTVELILLATKKYNKSIHSVIGKRPADVVVTQSNDPQCSRGGSKPREVHVCIVVCKESGG